MDEIENPTSESVDKAEVSDSSDEQQNENETFDDSKSAPENRETEGPFDESEANPARPYVDLGGIKVLPREGLHLRLEVEGTSQRVVAIGLDYGGSTLQVQPFAAPRSTGLWNEIRDQIIDQIQRQGGTTELHEGPFGLELRAEIPVSSPEGETETRLARFIGVDGPRWFLRGVIAGEAAAHPEAATDIEDLFRSLVIVRGDAPMPPRDLIPLHMPSTPPGHEPQESDNPDAEISSDNGDADGDSTAEQPNN